MAKNVNKIMLLSCLAIVAMTACNKQPVEIINNDAPILANVDFHLGAIQDNDEETRSIKTEWETGDVIFVFFSGKAAPAYLEMKWDGVSWTFTQKNNLVFSEGDIGQMRAVYLPFGNSATVVADGQTYRFSPISYSYYMTADLPYKVLNGGIEGLFKMKIPTGFVQFFLDDETASDSQVIELREAHLRSRTISAVNPDGTISEFLGPVGSPLVGYVYDKENKQSGDQKGYLFSGSLINSVRGVTTDYLFTVVQGGSSGNYFTKQFLQKTLYSSDKSGRAVKLPSLSSWNKVTTHKFVDLGIEVNGKRIYWSKVNLGATGEGELGDFYAWGETKVKDNYIWATYKHGNTATTLTKYNTKASNGIVDNKTVLEDVDDVVQVKLGGRRRIPTEAEWRALMSECSWTWKTTADGYSHNGYLVSGKGDYVSNSIFLPAAGIKRDDEVIDQDSFGAYWSSSLNKDTPSESWRLGFHVEYINIYSYYRSSGLSVRPVSE